MRASEGPWTATGPADRRCSDESDCQVIAAHVRCSDQCAVASLSASGLSAAQSVLDRVEAERCEPYLAAGCPALAAAPCTIDGAFPRCIEQRCVVVRSICPEGCSARDGELCDGEGACDGCPSILEDVVGKPCSTPHQRCGRPGCGSWGIDCSDDAQTGQFHWVPNIPAC
jgi:hypothetical protein